MFLRAKKECNSGAPKRNGRLCLGGQGGAEKKMQTGSAGTEQPTPGARGKPKRE